MPSVGWMARHPETVEAMPFDGVMADSFLRDRVFSDVELETESVRAVLEPYARTFGDRNRWDLLLLFASHGDTDLSPPGPFEDWTVVLSNVERVASEARRAGFKGIAFDNEPYGKNGFAFEACGERSVEGCAAQYIRRGKEIMETLERAWPEAVLLVFLGPWISVTAEGAYRKPFPMLGPFFAGLEAGRRRVRLLDGGEFYGLKTPEDFRKMTQKIRAEWPDFYFFLTAEQRERWERSVGQSFGVYDRKWGKPEKGRPLTPEELAEKLASAWAFAEGLVWLYTESHDWWGEKGKKTKLLPVPAAYPERIRRLREASGWGTWARNRIVK